jgi:hypothetical protein
VTESGHHSVLRGLGLGFGVSCFAAEAPVRHFRVQGLGLSVWGVGCMVYDFRFRVQASSPAAPRGSAAWRLGLKVQGSEFRVEGGGFKE